MLRWNCEPVSGFEGQKYGSLLSLLALTKFARTPPVSGLALFFNARRAGPAPVEKPQDSDVDKRNR